MKIIAKLQFAGIVPKGEFYEIMDYIDGMKINGWVFVKHERLDFGINVKFDYELEKYTL